MSDKYGVKDIFLTLQGEGVRAGTKAVFLRFTGCNLWSGRPAGRDTGEGACSRWCDTDFFKGSVLSIPEILAHLHKEWPDTYGQARWVVLTGGEPFLQINRPLVDALHDAGWNIAVETNGTVESIVADRIDHICIAPKLGADGEPLLIVLPHADEIKVVLPGDVPLKPGWTPAMLDEIALTWPKARLFVQPMDPLVDPSFVEETALKRTKDVEPNVEAELDARFNRHLQQCIAQVMRDPSWSLSSQTHKMWGLP